MNTKLEAVNGKYFVEIPHELIKLYSLEKEIVFEIKANEVVPGNLVIKLSTSLKG